jgi:hypothetical protein
MTDRLDTAAIRAELQAHRAAAVADIEAKEHAAALLREYVRGLDAALKLLPERKRRRPKVAAVKREAAE